MIKTKSSINYVRELGIGINIGNSLDVIGSVFGKPKGETGWRNPPITREFVKALKSYGYKTIRLPVTWTDFLGKAPEYKVAEERMNRVEEVLNWILDEDLFVIINLHHDGGESFNSWILDAAVDTDKITDKFTKVWKQIAERFASISHDKLIFESMNEVGFEKIWKRFGKTSEGKEDAYRILNLLNQTFVDTVRQIKGNENRYLLIAGYYTDIEQTCDALFQMPNDSAEDKLIVSVHYYTPASFCIFHTPDKKEGFRETWGTDDDYLQLKNLFQMLKENFIEKSIPVILGEYGVTGRNKDPQSRIKWMSAVTKICLEYGICPMLWDTGYEISRHPPFAMQDTLKAVWEEIKTR